VWGAIELDRKRWFISYSLYNLLYWFLSSSYLFWFKIQIKSRVYLHMLLIICSRLLEQWSWSPLRYALTNLMRLALRLNSTNPEFKKNLCVNHKVFLHFSNKISCLIYYNFFFSLLFTKLSKQLYIFIYC